MFHVVVLHSDERIPRDKHLIDIIGFDAASRRTLRWVEVGHTTHSFAFVARMNFELLEDW